MLDGGGSQAQRKFASLWGSYFQVNQNQVLDPNVNPWSVRFDRRGWRWVDWMGEGSYFDPL